jgi:hypothetical protein
MEFTQQRATFIRHLVARGLKNFRVLDTCCTTGCIRTAITPTRTSALRQVTAKDGVHFVTSGYRHITSAYVRATTQNTAKPHCHFWRGFRSGVGAACTGMQRHSQAQVRGNAVGGTAHRGVKSRGHFMQRGFTPIDADNLLVYIVLSPLLWSYNLSIWFALVLCAMQRTDAVLAFNRSYLAYYSCFYKYSICIYQ